MSLDIVIGPMFSGKSSYAISYIRRQRAIGKTVIVIKPNIDNRYSNEEMLVTHNQEQTPCMIWPVHQQLNPCIPQIRDADCIVLEETQFFKGVRNFVGYSLQAYKKNILLVGLDGTANQQPFGEIFDCIPWATTVNKLCALCVKCRDGTLAPFTKKICSEDNQMVVDVGGSEKYEAVCLKHLDDIQ
jgi:thymidine kinase